MSILAKNAARVAAAVTSLVLVVPTPAVADDSTSPLGLSMSENGPWTTSLSTPLFDPDMLWVPGDTVTSGFWAANRSDDTTEFRITLLPWQQALMSTGEFEMRVRSGDDRWEPIRSAWTAPRPLAAGEKMHVQLRATLKETASNATQTLAFGFDIRTRLTYQVPVVVPTTRPTPAPSPTPTPGPGGTEELQGPEKDTNDTGANDAPAGTPREIKNGSLAGTGADQPSWLPPVGFGALITGVWMALAARRRDRRESDAA